MTFLKDDRAMFNQVFQIFKTKIGSSLYKYNSITNIFLKKRVYYYYGCGLVYNSLLQS